MFFTFILCVTGLRNPKQDPENLFYFADCEDIDGEISWICSAVEEGKQNYSIWDF